MRASSSVVGPSAAASRAGASFAAALVALVLAAGSAQARREAPVIELEAETNATTVEVGDSFQLDIVLTVRTNSPVEELRLPDFRGFTVLRDERSKGSKVEIRGPKRQVTHEQRYSYMLRAESVGTLVIGAATARLGTNRARSEPVTIRVVPSQSDPDAPAGAAGQPYFLEARLDKTEAWVGEQVTLLVQLYAKSPVDARNLELPKLPRFWIEQLQSASTRPTERTVGGERYFVYVLHGSALFPLEAGDQEVGPVQITVQTGAGLWKRGRSYVLKSAPSKLKVKPLPRQGRPADFEPGNVGQFRLEARITPVETRVGEPVTLEVVARGQGNPAQLKLPDLPQDIPGVRLFPPTFEEQKGIDQGRIHGVRKASVLIQPLVEGRIRIPALTLAYFDPQSGRYEEATSRPLMILVGEGAATGGAAGGKSRIDKGARPIRTHLVPPSGLASAYRSPAFLPAAAAALVGGVVAWGAGRSRARRRAQGAHRKTDAQKRNRAALAQAVQHQNLRQVQAAVVNHLALAFGEEVRGKPLEELEPWLIARGRPPGEAARLVAFLREGEAVLYAPPGAGGRGALFREAQDLVDVIERAGEPE